MEDDRTAGLRIEVDEWSTVCGSQCVSAEHEFEHK